MLIVQSKNISARAAPAPPPSSCTGGDNGAAKTAQQQRRIDKTAAKTAQQKRRSNNGAATTAKRQRRSNNGAAVLYFFCEYIFQIFETKLKCQRKDIFKYVSAGTLFCLPDGRLHAGALAECF